MGEQLHQCVMEPSDVEHNTGQANSVPNNQNIVAEINEGNGVDEKVIAGLDEVESFARCVCRKPCGIGVLVWLFQGANELF